MAADFWQENPQPERLTTDLHIINGVISFKIDKLNETSKTDFIADVIDKTNWQAYREK